MPEIAYEKWSGRKLYHWLKFDLNFKTAGGNKNLSLGNIYRLLENPFYYGVFEYPLKSGNWYQGRHKALITKELYDEVQKQLKGNELKTRQEKEFAFTRLMKCGLCGSGICADEKYKKLKDGSVNSHIYYGCTKVRDKNCQCGYINENDLIKQFQILIDKLDLNESGIKQRLETEVPRYKKFHKSLTGESIDIEVSDLDIRQYVKFLLQGGTSIEKRDVIGCFKSKIILNKKQVTLE